MRVSVNGFDRNHGIKILFDKALSEVKDETVESNISKYDYVPRNEPIIYIRKNDIENSSISINTRVGVTMQGNYRLEIRFTLSDILILFWLAFKDKALQMIFQLKARVTETATSAA